MAKISRRDVLAGGAAMLGSLGASGGTFGQQPTENFDLVIRGGEVIDPSQNLRGIRDIGIKFGQVAAVEPSIPAERAKQSIDAKGKLVTPGLVDLHTHVYPYGSAIGIPPDELVPFSATTT
ncbi:MAG: amidohydrolase family protein, partial [Tardiphaga sp.]